MLFCCLLTLSGVDLGPLNTDIFVFLFLKNISIGYLPTATPSSGRSVTYFSQDRYDPYIGGYYSDMYAGYPGYAPYFNDRYRDYSRGKKK